MSPYTVEYTTAMETMPRYYRWKSDLVHRHAGSRVLEVGCGTGSLLAALPPREALAGVDREPGCVERARRRFASRSDITWHHLDVLDPGFLRLKTFNADTVVFSNALELVAEDALALKRAAEVLVPGGRLLVLAAAMPGLTGALDRGFGQRRYTREGLASLMVDAGCVVTVLRYVNLLGAAAWWWESRWRGRDRVEATAYAGRDRFVPLARLVDRVTGPPFGRWLFAAGTLSDRP